MIVAVRGNQPSKPQRNRTIGRNGLPVERLDSLSAGIRKKPWPWKLFQLKNNLFDAFVSGHSLVERSLFGGAFNGRTWRSRNQCTSCNRSWERSDGRTGGRRRTRGSPRKVRSGGCRRRRTGGRTQQGSRRTGGGRSLRSGACRSDSCTRNWWRTNRGPCSCCRGGRTRRPTRSPARTSVPSWVGNHIRFRYCCRFVLNFELENRWTHRLLHHFQAGCSCLFLGGGWSWNGRVKSKTGWNSNLTKPLLYGNQCHWDHAVKRLCPLDYSIM